MNAINDKHRVDELLKGLMIGPWGQRSAPEKEKEEAKNPGAKKPKYPTSLSMIGEVSRSFFEQSFQKVLLVIAVKNCLKLLDYSGSNSQNGLDIFLKHYSVEKDPIYATF